MIIDTFSKIVVNCRHSNNIDEKLNRLPTKVTSSSHGKAVYVRCCRTELYIKSHLQLTGGNSKKPKFE